MEICLVRLNSDPAYPTIQGWNFWEFRQVSARCVQLRYPLSYFLIFDMFDIEMKCLECLLDVSLGQGDHGLSPTIEVLHIRASGPMLRERIPDNLVAYDVLPSYAEWAFGREGYLHLQVLAYGDFSHDGCYNDYNRLWYRTGRYGFKVLKPSDAKFWDLVQEYKDVLGACAFDELFLERGIPR